MFYQTPVSWDPTCDALMKFLVIFYLQPRRASEHNNKNTSFILIDRTKFDFEYTP